MASLYRSGPSVWAWLWLAGILATLCTVLGLVGCTNSAASVGSELPPLEEATRFRLGREGDDFVIEIHGATDDSDATFTYRLARDRNQRSAQTVPAPARRIVCLSSTHLGFLAELDALDTLVGISLLNHIANADIRAKIDAGAVVSVGIGASVDVEKLITLDPDVVVAFGLSPADLDPLAPVMNADIPVILCADYTEPTPLGRAEWIKFFGLLVGKEELANRRFEEVCSEYKRLAAMGHDAKTKPTVFLNASFQGIWYQPGGDSYMARFLADAGAEYVWAGDRDSRVLRLDFEAVLRKAGKADFWLNPGFWSSLADGLANDSRYASFQAFQTGNVFNHNRLGDLTTGNDFFERGAARPDLVLADLLHIFHPELLPDHQPIWYHRLPKE